ncbi:MAG: tRNA (adenosine(37)-N6)-threonylcarbamoyltransferase complex dimerization subunit type 1 TsaB [Vulcanimicrobiota bacterium]
MNTILAMDTTGDTFTVAVWREHCLAEVRGLRPRTHLRQLVPSLMHACAVAGLTLKDVTRLAVTVGPGSFTGVRLGILTARTLGQTLDLPIVPVKTLEALALNGRAGGLVLAANDARKEEIYSAVYRLEEGPVELVGAAARRLPEVLELIRAHPGVAVVGNAWQRYHRELGQATGGPVAPRRDWSVRGEAVAWLGQRDDDRAVSWLELAPDYLRAPDVQVAR